MSSFIGRYDYTIDEKGRVNIPAKFRKATPAKSKNTFVVTVGMDICLQIFPLEGWVDFEKSLKNNLTWNILENRRYFRTIMANASESTVDKQGRIMIPPHLLEYAGIQKEVVIIGVADRIELWNPREYQSHLGSMAENMNAISMKLNSPNQS